jgi:hypothetical protein
VSAKTHLGVNEVDPFADAGEAWNKHLVTLGRQLSVDRAPTPGAAPTAGHQTKVAMTLIVLAVLGLCRRVNCKNGMPFLPAAAVLRV